MEPSPEARTVRGTFQHGLARTWARCIRVLVSIFVSKADMVELLLYASQAAQVLSQTIYVLFTS